MPEISFPWTFPYGYLDRNVREPVVPLRLLLQDQALDIQVLVDTGAERTLLDGLILRALGRDIFSGREVTFRGFLGSSLVAYEHRARVQLAGLELELELAFSIQPMTRQVLGRDVLAHLLLGLRESALELYLAPDEHSGSGRKFSSMA